MAKVTAEWFRVGSAWAACPHKCGSTSFRAAVAGVDDQNILAKGPLKFREFMSRQGRGPVRPDRLPEGTAPRYLAIREPVERFVSLWRSLWGASEAGKDTVLIRDYDLKFASPDDLMDVIEANDDANYHWLRQAAYLCEGVTLVSSEDLLETLGLEIRNANPSQPIDVPDLPLNRIFDHFAVDLSLHAQVVEQIAASE